MKTFSQFLTEAEYSAAPEVEELHCHDIDDTLLKTHARIYVNDHKGNRTRSLTPDEYNTHKLPKNHSYDFSEFRDASKFHDTSTPIKPGIDRLIDQQKDKKKRTIMVTARTDFSDKTGGKQKVLNTFKRNGIDMKKCHLHRAGNEGGSGPENKVKVIQRHLDAHKYKHAHLYDDCSDNLDSFKKMKEKNPDTQFHAHHVQHDGGIKDY